MFDIVQEIIVSGLETSDGIETQTNKKHMDHNSADIGGSSIVLNVSYFNFNW